MEDSQIIQLYLTRNESAINETSDKYGNYCRKIAYNILSNHEDSEECFNDALLGTWNAIPPEKPAKLSSFIGRITRNIALDKFDYNRAKKRHSEFTLILDELNECIPSTEYVENRIMGREISGVISTFLYGVKEEHRNIFIKRYWYADSIAALSADFGVSESKVKSILFRTRKKLGNYLEKEGYNI